MTERRTGTDRRRDDETKARVKCPHCGCSDNEVVRVNQRASDGVVVRRHQCACGRRFTSEQHARAA